MSSRNTARAAPLCAVVVATLTSACASTPHEVQLTVTASMPVSTVGNGTDLYFQFVDDRDDVTVGHRGIGTVGAKITAENVAKLVERRLRTMLRNKGYALLNLSTGSEAAITYRLRAFKFEIESGFFTAGKNADVALAVDASRGAKSYKTVYRSNSEERTLVDPGGDAIDQQLNAGLTDVLSKAANDAALDRLLTAR